MNPMWLRLAVVLLFPIKLPIFFVCMIVLVAAQIPWMLMKWVYTGDPPLADDPWIYCLVPFLLWPMPEQKEK